MPKFITPLLCSGFIVLAFSSPALAHPEKADPPKASADKAPINGSNEDLNAYFEKHAQKLKEALGQAATAQDGNTSSERRIDIIEDPEALRQAAKDIQNKLAESGLLESLADTIIALAEDIEITDTGDGMRFGFDGKELGGVEKKGDDVVSIDAFGKNTRIEKEVFIENGKKKTRIVIETDADDETEFEIVPKAKKPPVENGF